MEMTIPSILRGIKKCVLVVLSLFFFFSCGELKYYEKIILIPEGYDGQVRIFWNDSTSHNQIFRKDENFFMIVLNGDLMNFRMKDPPTPTGAYTTKYYYFSKDTIYQISSAGFANSLPEYPGASSGYWGEENGEKVFGFTVKKTADGNDYSKFFEGD
jgi:hypothetical protein